jgi:hypothetical protein
LEINKKKSQKDKEKDKKDVLNKEMEKNENVPPVILMFGMPILDVCFTTDEVWIDVVCLMDYFA